ncbi:MAG: TIGR03546 family protein [Planctomycetota bacterium]
MLNWAGDWSRFCKGLLVRDRQPHHLALGLAFGVALGLLPKANLISLGLVTLIFALRTDLLTCLVTTFVCTWIGALIDPVLGGIGQWILQLGFLQGTFAWLYQLPIVPWTNFNNTVVMGACCLALIQAYPTYAFAKRYFTQRQTSQTDWRVRSGDAVPSGPLSGVWRIG